MFPHASRLVFRLRSLAVVDQSTLTQTHIEIQSTGDWCQYVLLYYEGVCHLHCYMVLT